MMDVPEKWKIVVIIVHFSWLISSSSQVGWWLVGGSDQSILSKRNLEFGMLKHFVSSRSHH